MEEIKITVDGVEYLVKVEETEEGKILVHSGQDVFEVETEHNKSQALFNKARKKELEGQGQGVVLAPLPGVITDIKVKVGDQVEESQPIVKLIAMKMENEISAPKKGVVKEIRIKKDDAVKKDDILLVIE